jgi:hypothetical protein
LSTLTGTQVLLLIASETGHVYSFATPKLQPMITHRDGKAMIQACLNSDEIIDENTSLLSNGRVSIRLMFLFHFVSLCLILIFGLVLISIHEYAF